MKKFMVLLTSLVLTFSLAACGGDTKEATENTENTSESTTTNNGEEINVGIMQISEHPSLDEIRAAIETELKNSGLNINIDYQNAQNDYTNLTSIADKFVGDQKDMIIAIATPTAQAAQAATSDIPIVYAAVTDPISAGLDGENITGTSDAIPVDKIFELMNNLTPGVKNLGMVYNTGEANSLAVIEDAKDYCDLNGITVVESTITNSSELAQAAQNLVGKVDAIFTPIDNTVAEAMPVLADVAKENKIPIYTGADSLVKDGGFATVGVNYTNLGTETGKIAVEVLNGKVPSEIPYKVLDDLNVVINETTAEACGIEIPEDIKSTATLVK